MVALWGGSTNRIGLYMVLAFLLGLQVATICFSMTTIMVYDENRLLKNKPVYLQALGLTKYKKGAEGDKCDDAVIDNQFQLKLRHFFRLVVLIKDTFRLIGMKETEEESMAI